MIDPKIVEEIKLRNPIEDVMAGYADVRRAGSNMICLCPFHSEKTPSCTVFVARQSFYCFGCGAGGDVISLVRRAEGLEYVEALEFLGRRCGVEVIDNSYDGPRYDKNRYYALNREAARYFHDTLMSSPVGAPGREYAEFRGLSATIIKHFGLGFAPDSFSGLTAYLRDAGYTQEEITQAFLGGVGKNGKLYDMFRNRLMFPVIDLSGNVIAFSGRIIDKSSDRKYINSADTPVFKKRRNLFALNFARSSCSERMLLCEGNLDVVTLHAAGFENAVATLGTAITPDQARLMSKYTKKVIICYDNDSAGISATEKAIKLIEETGTETAVLQVSDAKDPDEFIKKFGAPAFSKLLGESRSRFRFSLDTILKQYDMADTDQRVRAIADICRMLSAVYSVTEREIYTREIADELGVSKESIDADTKRLMRRDAKEKRNEESTSAHRQLTGIGDRVNPDYARHSAAATTEEQILALLMLYQEHRATVARYPEMLSEKDFSTAFGKKVFTEIIRMNDDAGYSDARLGEHLTVEEVSRLEKMKVRRLGLTDNGESVFAALAAALREETKRQTMSASVSTPEQLAAYLKELRKKQ